MSSHYCKNKLVDIVTRDYMGAANKGVNFKARRFAPAVGAKTSFHSGYHSLQFNRGFFNTCSLWANNMHYHFDKNSLYEDGRLIVDWIGDVGTKACHRSTSSHNRARGFDLAQIKFTNGWLMDCNWSPQNSDLQKRRYLAVAANLRRYFGTVLTAWYNSAHRDHMQSS